MNRKSWIKTVSLTAALLLLGGCTKSYTTTPLVAPPVGKPPCPNCGTAAPAPMQPITQPNVNPSMVPGNPPGTIPNGSPPPNVPRTGPSLSESRSSPGQARLGQPGAADIQRAQALSPAPLEFPTDIPRFALVYDQVATGQEPFADGYAWLAKQGYRTVLYIHSSSETDLGQLTKAVEKQGLKLMDLTLDPSTLSKAKVTEFSQTINNTALQPIFVFDRKGALAGSLWYLHFRTQDGLNEKQAQERAIRLGLPSPDEQDNGSLELWQAIKRMTE